VNEVAINDRGVIQELLTDHEQETEHITDIFYAQTGGKEAKEEEIARGLSQVKIGMMFSFLLLFLIIGSSDGIYIPDVVVFFIVYYLVFFCIAIHWGGIRETTVKGAGTARPFLEHVQLGGDDIDELEGYCDQQYLPEFPWFLKYSNLNEEDRTTLYRCLGEDFNNGVRPWFERHDDIFSIIETNAGYSGMFFIMSVPFFILFLANKAFFGGMAMTWWMILLCVVIEESVKGIGFFSTTTIENYYCIKVLPGTFSPVANKYALKGVVAGCGYAFIETFSRLETGINPLLNFIIRLPTLALHIVATALVFSGLGVIKEGWVEADQRRKTQAIAWGILLILLAIGIHIMYNLVATGIVEGVGS